MPTTQHIGEYSEYLKSVRIYLDESDIFGYKFTYAIQVPVCDGDVIFSFPVPDNCEGKTSIEFFKSDSHILAQADFNWYDDEKGHMHTVRFYRIDKNSGVAKIIREENHMSARPNPVSAGTPSVSIPTGNLSPGIYLFTLTENGKPAETCKIIIR